MTRTVLGPGCGSHQGGPGFTTGRVPRVPGARRAAPDPACPRCPGRGRRHSGAHEPARARCPPPASTHATMDRPPAAAIAGACRLGGTVAAESACGATPENVAGPSADTTNEPPPVDVPGIASAVHVTNGSPESPTAAAGPKAVDRNA